MDYNIPTTTYTFNAYTYNEENSDTTDVKVEWSTKEKLLQDLCDKFADFVRAAGYTYVTNITFETESSSLGYCDEEWDFSSEQPEQPELDFGQPGHPYDDVKVTYGRSINDATPEQWNAAFTWKTPK